jgi:hypothetical protein
LVGPKETQLTGKKKSKEEIEKKKRKKLIEKTSQPDLLFSLSLNLNYVRVALM